MDKTYDADESRQLVLDLGTFPVVLSKVNWLPLWKYDKPAYKKEMKSSDCFH